MATLHGLFHHANKHLYFNKLRSLSQGVSKWAVMSLLKSIRHRRLSSHVIIDSHAVTKETYGFRVTPFSLRQLDKIAPTLIVVLYSEPSLLIKRITRKPQGRPLPTQYEAAFHNDLQANVALGYGIHLGIPVYFFDADRETDELAAQLARRVQ